jgi:hypothetical protein
MGIYHIDMVILDIDMGDEANDMGDDKIDTVISHIDMGYHDTLDSSTSQLTGSTSCIIIWVVSLNSVDKNGSG